MYCPGAAYFTWATFQGFPRSRLSCLSHPAKQIKLSSKQVVRFETGIAWYFAELLTQFNFFLKSFFVKVWIIVLSVSAIEFLILCAGSHSRNQSYFQNGHPVIHTSAEVIGAVVC
jgi:hypothetical protein